MRQFYYNLLRTNRIKAVSLNMLVVLMYLPVIYLFSNNVLTLDDKGLFITVVVLVVLVIVLSNLLVIRPFQQVIEKSKDGDIVTYYQFKFGKVKCRTHGKFVGLTLERDAKRYYCIIVKTANEEMMLEKYPTLDQANERLEAARLSIG